MPKRKPTKPQIPDARAIFERVEKIAAETLADALEEWGEEIREEFVGKIEQQAFASFQEIFYPESGTNLSPSWLRIKELAGADLRTMIATGHYVDSIEVFRRYDRREKKHIIRVGFHHSAKPRDLQGRTVDIEIPGTGITGLTALAIVHELGSVKANIPARPHWRPHRERVATEASGKARQFRKAISKAIKDDRKLKGRVAVGVRG
jgi:hypothetical protein